MKKRFVIGVFAAIAAVALSSCSSQMYTLKSSNSKTVMGKTVNAPYANVVNYFGYVAPEVKPAGNYKGKDAYYLYVWVPAVIDELGVSMYSPVDAKPGSGDFVHPAFESNFKKDPNAFFDTFLALDRMVILDAAKIKDGASAAVMPLGTNDDTSEIPANPAGRQYNSLLRAISDTKSPTKALVRSVYRITFTSFRGNVKGSYLVQVGTNVPGVKIAASLDELHKIVNEAK
jgi:predicted small secreted protein